MVVFKESQPIRAALQVNVACCIENRGSRAVLTFVHFCSQVTQSFFSPASPNNVPFQQDLVAAGCTQGHDLVSLLFRSIMGGLQSSLWSNVAETLYCIVQGCIYNPYRSDCMRWVRSALDQDIEFAKRVSPPMREMVLIALFRYGDDKVKFKVLIQDIARVCSSEIGVDCLLIHQE